MEISIHHSDGTRFAVEARQHRLILDQPAEDGGTDRGMSPAELLLASLGGCVGQYVAQYLSLRRLPAEGLEIRVAARPASRPLFLDEFTVEIIAPGLSERQLRAFEKSVPAGLVQNAIHYENSVRVTCTAAKEPAKPKRKPL